MTQNRRKVASSSTQTRHFHIEAIRIFLCGGGLLLFVYVVLASFVSDSPNQLGAVQTLRWSPGNNNNSINGSLNAIMASQPEKRHGVFCFGDSLTAGTSGFDEYPYANYLQQALDETAATNSKPRVEVRHVGFPGWTVRQFRREKNHPRRGLVTWIQNWQTSSSSSNLELVILLGGTNDLVDAGAEASIADDIIDLHRACYESGVPRTIAIAIPSSAYQAKFSPEAAKLASSVNKKLAEFSTGDPRCTFVEFPFGYDDENMANWNPDGLHLSEKGYQVLGRYLRPYVEQILQTPDRNGFEGAN